MDEKKFQKFLLSFDINSSLKGLFNAFNIIEGYSVDIYDSNVDLELKKKFLIDFLYYINELKKNLNKNLYSLKNSVYLIKDMNLYQFKMFFQKQLNILNIIEFKFYLYLYMFSNDKCI